MLSLELRSPVRAAALILGVALLGLGACGERDGVLKTKPQQKSATESLPTPRAGLWKTTTAMTDGTREEATDCIESGTSPLQALSATDLSRCPRHAVTRSATGYHVDVSCASDGMTMSLKGEIVGDFANTMTTDLDLGIGVEGEAVQSTHLHSESRYIGPCPAA